MVFDANLYWEVFSTAINPRRMGHQLFADMLEQAQAVDRLGYLGTTIPEHPSIKILVKAHFDNYLMSDYIGFINYASK